METTSTSSSTPSSSSSHISLSSTLSLPKSCSKHITSKIENLVEYSYIPESAQINESQFPVMSPYNLYKQKTSFTRSIRTLISTKRPLPKEYIQSSRLDRCALQASQSEQYVTLEIPPDLVANWKREGYTHIHLGGVRLILTLHGRKGLPVTTRIALLDTRFKQYQHDVIGTVLTTLHADSVLLTFYPNFNLSLEDPNLPTTIKVQIQLQGAEQTPTSKIATLHHQIIQKQELLTLMPLEWLTNYEHFHQNSEPVQTTEATFERRQNGQVKLSFQTPETKLVSDTPQLSYIAMITAVHTGQEKNLPIHGFSSVGYPVYPDTVNGHFLWDVPEAHMCNPNCPCLDDTDIEDELKTMRRRKKKKKKSSFPKKSCKSFPPQPPPDPKPTVQPIRPQPPIYNQFFGFSHLQPTPQPKPTSPKKSKSKVKISKPQSKTTSSSFVPPVPPEDSPKATPEPPKKDKGPMDQYHYHTIQNTSSDSSESNPSSSSSSSTDSIGTSIDTESEYADITSILITTKTEDPSASTATPIVEETFSDTENQAAPTEPEPSMPPPVSNHSNKPSSASWFTFDDIPCHKWPARL
ncbi:hypothetical protein KPL71_021625 [Citrus sinensis]|uniref:Uncharacterized protein n=1 Tax=Citrus sinensis TaxID=2711 RepID=A0ACB8JJ12_CITSI|nr:hypothetical protein KPL71_021625 [Citrus sinensis]